MEHRWGYRTSTHVAVRLVALPGTIGAGRILNVSETGAYVQTNLALPLLALVHLQPIGPRAVNEGMRRIAACVVRRSGDGIGLEWCDDAPHAVDQFLSAVLGRDDGPRQDEQPRRGYRSDRKKT